MSILFIPIGLPGSGKSTWAKETDAIVVSSDAIRGELFGDASIQGDPKRVFALMGERTIAAISAGHDVIYDATNLTKWARKSIIDKLPASCEVVFVEFTASVDVCIKRQNLRTRKVPSEVIINMASRREAVSIDEAGGRKYRIDYID